MGKLEGRHFLITGASSGIGLATLKMFLDEGANITGMARGMDAFRSKLDEQGISASRVELVAGDVGNPADITRFVEQGIARFGRLDGLVHSAGKDVSGPFMETSYDEWLSVIHTNLCSGYLLCQAVLPLLEQAGGGVITFVASGAGVRPLPNRSLYSASKAGLIAMGKSIAAEVALKKIRVNTICPGIINTPMLERAWKEAPDPEAAMAELSTRNAMHRFAEPEEIAVTILHMSCDDTAFMTGSAVVVDGGRAYH